MFPKTEVPTLVPVETLPGEFHQGGSPPAVYRAGSGPWCDHVEEIWCCPRDGTMFRRPAKCSDERRCPVCVVAWAWHEARVAALRIRARKERYEPRHVVVSPSPHAYEDVPGVVASLRRDVREVLRKMGFRGGLLVVHLWRHRETENGCGPTEWFWGPHAHVVGYGVVDAVRRPPGWYVESMREKQGSLEATVSYLVNHAAVVPGGHAVTWFGHLSYNKFGASPSLPVGGGPACPRCGGPMERVCGPEDFMLVRAVVKAGRRRGRGEE